MSLLIFYFLLALVVSFVCSLMEAVILSVRTAHVELLVKSGSPAGGMLQRLKSRLDLPLAAILTLNTIANVVGSAGVGAEANRIWGGAWVGVTAAVLTICILVGSEIIPKTIGARYWKPLSIPAAYVISFMIFVLYPVVFLLNLISRVVSKGDQPHMITRDEMLIMAELGFKAGTIQDRETKVIANMLQLSQLHVSEVMTPRVAVFAVDKDATVGEIVRKHSPIRFSRLPVYEENSDKIIGKVLTRKLLELCVTGKENVRVEEIMTELLPIPETATLAKLLDEFIRRHTHMFFVVNEYGGTEGLITLEDAIETVLGVEIVDELDAVPDLRKLALERMRRRRAELHMDQ